MRDDAPVGSITRPGNDLAPILDDELADEELCRQTNVKLCCGSPGCQGLCPVFPSGVHSKGLEAESDD